MIRCFSRWPRGAAFTVSDGMIGQEPLPSGLKRPIFAVPVSNPVRCYAVALYGGHASGADLDLNERDMLARLGENAAAVFAELENEDLRGRIDRLERELGLRREAVGSRP